MARGVNPEILATDLQSDSFVVKLYERWYSKIELSSDDDCWNWCASKDNHGYGKMSSSWKKAPHKAHRLAVYFYTGKHPEGHVLHSCDNPSCVNPRHLSVGTQKENMRQASDRGRLNPNSLKNLHPGCRGHHGAGPISTGDAS